MTLAVPEHMRAITLAGFGGPEVLRQERVPVPLPGPNEVLIRTAAIGFNRADAVQREGQYAAPAGTSPILGLECSGEIIRVGSAVTHWVVGDQVCALLPGGGYAEFAVASECLVLPLPCGVDPVQAAALPEAAATVLSNLAHPALPQLGSWLLFHGGSGGVGSFGVQFARALGYRVLATAGTTTGIQHCLDAGANAAINYQHDRVEDLVREHTRGEGVSFILDVDGAPTLKQNLRLLGPGGRLALIAGMGGTMGEIDLQDMMRRRLTLHGSTLRGRPLTGTGSKAEIIAQVRSQVWPMLEDGSLRLLPAHTAPLSEAAAVHSSHQQRQIPPGKTVLTIAD